MSKTGVTCCVKEAKAGESTDAKRLQDAIRLEIICLRRVAHVRPPQLLSGMTKTNSSIALHCPVL